MGSTTSARVALVAVLGGLLLALTVFSPVAAGNHGKGGNKNAGCNQNKETPEHHYDADCDGSASENGNSGNGNGGNGNGNGNGKGGGKPCAGCVGKADNKHPPGQEPDENDRNKGYECDDNKGVGAERGSGNPAHTGCRPPRQSTPTPTPSTSTTPPGTPPVTPPVVPTPSESTPGTITPTVSPNVIDNCDANESMPGIQVCGNIIGNGGDGGDDTAADRAAALPFTGVAIGTVLLIGIAMVAGGLATMRRRGR